MTNSARAAERRTRRVSTPSRWREYPPIDRIVRPNVAVFLALHQFPVGVYADELGEPTSWHLRVTVEAEIQSFRRVTIVGLNAAHEQQSLPVDPELARVQIARCGADDVHGPSLPGILTHRRHREVFRSQHCERRFGGLC